VPASPEEVTQLLRQWQAGDRAALHQLMPIVYHELRRLAAGHLRRERAGHTLQPTALVAEVYLRLVGEGHKDWSGRVDFYAAAARHMRQILVDHARRRRARKRGGGARAVTLDDGALPIERPGDLVALDDALEALSRFDERKARTVELHYFGGLTHEEAAAVLGVHVNTVARDLRLARAWLHRELSGAR
jgi:RNA polymerase sigma factor (TIGR02999 family)